MIPEDYTLEQAVDLNRRLHRRIQLEEGEKVIMKLTKLQHSIEHARSTTINRERYDAYHRGFESGLRAARQRQMKDTESWQKTVAVVVVGLIGLILAVGASASLAALLYH